MATVEEGLQAQIRNIEATYGKPMREWLAIVAASGLTKHTDVVRMLKSDYGMTHGAAHRVSLVARDSAAGAGPDQDTDPISALYTGKKASLRPLHDALMAGVTPRRRSGRCCSCVRPGSSSAGNLGSVVRVSTPGSAYSDDGDDTAGPGHTRR